MPELIDCHVHTARCGHASGEASEYIEAARRRSISTLVFTEHLPLPQRLDPMRRLSLHPDDLAVYAEEILALAAATVDVKVVLGIEVDWLPGDEEHMLAMLHSARALGVQVVMGSVHFLGDWAFDDPAEIGRWSDQDVDAVYAEYFDRWSQATASGIFDVMAHPDLPKKFGHRPSGDTSAMYAQAAAAAASSATAIEISTAGLRKPVGEMYPAPRLLEAFFAAGVQVTVGSDAHAPTDVGRSLEQAYALAASVGYTSLVCPDGEGQWRKVDIWAP